jgi:signal transduction histidine kinase
MHNGNERDPTRRRLERLERLLACFQKALGHEIPNQLVAIGGLLQLLELEEGERLGLDGRDYLGRLHAGVQKLQLLAVALADLARVARPLDRPAGQAAGDEKRAPGSVGQMVEEVVVEVKQLFPGRVIEYHISPTAHTLTVSRPDLRTVLLPLLRHAVQRSGEGRPVRLEIDARRSGTEVELCLADDGPEIPADRQATLFDPFPGAGPGDVAQGGNPPHNLGLFLAQQVVAGWGGCLGLASAPGQGCTFTIRIP